MKWKENSKGNGMPYCGECEKEQYNDFFGDAFKGEEINLSENGWVPAGNGKWAKTNAFIDMQDGSSCMDEESAKKLQKIINDWKREAR